MDIATILGVISAFGLMCIAISMGGGIQLFINIPALMIVVGGTLGATMINYPVKDVLGVFKVVKKALFAKKISVTELIKRFVTFAKKSRKEGILTLEGDIKDEKSEVLQEDMNAQPVCEAFYRHARVKGYNSLSTDWSRKRSVRSSKQRLILSEADTNWVQRFLPLREHFLLPWE